jgi:hypothetical protein
VASVALFERHGTARIIRRELLVTGSASYPIPCKKKENRKNVLHKKDKTEKRAGRLVRQWHCSPRDRFLTRASSIPLPRSTLCVAIVQQHHLRGHLQRRRCLSKEKAGACFSGSIFLSRNLIPVFRQPEASPEWLVPAGHQRGRQGVDARTPRLTRLTG